MIEAVSCGGVVIHKGKALLLYKNQNGRFIGWVMPKGTLEHGESLKQAALREVSEETGARARIVGYVGKTRYGFRAGDDTVNKTVHWYLMIAESYYCKPQAEEFFADAGYYKRHEAYHLLKFHDERQMLMKAYMEYDALRNSGDRFKRRLIAD